MALYSVAGRDDRTSFSSCFSVGWRNIIMTGAKRRKGIYISNVREPQKFSGKYSVAGQRCADRTV
jgi:hypothetical protein